MTFFGLTVVTLSRARILSGRWPNVKLKTRIRIFRYRVPILFHSPCPRHFDYTNRVLYNDRTEYASASNRPFSNFILKIAKLIIAVQKNKS